MSNPAGFLLSYANHAVVQTDWALTLDPSVTGQTVTVGTLDSLRDPRLSTRCTIQNSRVDAGAVRIQLLFEMPEGGQTIEAKLIGLLNNTINATGATGITIEADVTGTELSVAFGALWNPPTADFPRHMWAFNTTLEQDGITSVRVWVEATFGSGGGTLTLTTGGLWIGPGWVPSDGIEAQWRMDVIDPGQMARSAGGQGFARQRQRYRQLSAKVVNMPVEWAYGVAGGTNIDVQQLLYRIGTTTPVVVFARTNDAAGAQDVHTQHRLGIYGHFTELGSIEHVRGDRYEWTGFRVAELL